MRKRLLFAHKTIFAKCSVIMFYSTVWLVEKLKTAFFVKGAAQTGVVFFEVERADERTTD